MAITWLQNLFYHLQTAFLSSLLETSSIFGGSPIAVEIENLRAVSEVKLTVRRCSCYSCSTRYLTREIPSWILREKFHISKQPCINILLTRRSRLNRWSGDVIRRTGMKNFNAVSHNRARPYFRIQHGRGEVRARRVYLNVHSVTGNVIDKELSVEFWRWKCFREFGNNT